MNVPNWINVLVYIVTVQSRHCIVILNNQVFCLQKGDGRVEILDKEVCALYTETPTEKSVTSVLNVDYSFMCPQKLAVMSTHEGCESFGMDLIKLACDCLGRLPALADANIKYKFFRFDGHVSMLQLWAGLQADKYQDRSR